MSLPYENQWLLLTRYIPANNNSFTYFNGIAYIWKNNNHQTEAATWKQNQKRKVYKNVKQPT